MERAAVASEPCPMGGTHVLTMPALWVGTSCRKCHRTWEGSDLTPTWPDTPPPVTATDTGRNT